MAKSSRNDYGIVAPEFIASKLVGEERVFLARCSCADDTYVFLQIAYEHLLKQTKTEVPTVLKRVGADFCDCVLANWAS